MKKGSKTREAQMLMELQRCLLAEFLISAWARELADEFAINPSRIEIALRPHVHRQVAEHFSLSTEPGELL
jgi:hypothetical protein